ncbi:DUF4044 domain-containing protein [Lacticaseibacillus jixiensis]
MKREPHTKFWWITHIAAWAMLIVTILGSLLAAVSVFTG